MSLQIALLLGQDGMTSGAIYALLALSIVLVFTVTRVLLVPQGEFVTFGALTLAALQAGQPARLAWLLLGLAAAVALQRAWQWQRGSGPALRWSDAGPLAYAGLMLALALGASAAAHSERL